ncbi:MAG: helix-turn-helix domain-containing protein [Nanoarchaeota archaeon]|nr:helix-turn-helix domain-containing protein [Nanoarchaeota archaeon]
MVFRRIILEEEDGAYLQEAEVFEKPSSIKPLVSELAWNILLSIKDEPLYPLQIAKKLNVHEQKVYYHINNLVKAGLVKVVKEEDIKGASAKFYSPVSPVFAVDLGFGKSPAKNNGVASSKTIDFFKEFNKDNFNGYIIVGSPEAHGPLKTWANDGHYSNYLAFFLGNFIKFSHDSFIELDIDVKARNKFDDNFILIGGPGVNVITYEFNNYLPVKFDTQFIGEAPSANFGKGFISSKTKKVYTNPAIGVIEKIENPNDKNKTVILLAGVSKRGTLSALLALTREPDKILKDYTPGKPFARVVEGFDLSGDGKIDNFEVKE